MALNPARRTSTPQNPTPRTSREPAQLAAPEP
jgi:hypothetical protein